MIFKLYNRYIKTAVAPPRPPPICRGQVHHRSIAPSLHRSSLHRSTRSISI